MNRIRQERIKKYIENQNVATIKELREVFPEVSLMTLHRDLSALEEMGIITKYRGGVRSVHQLDDIEFNIRMKENTAGKTSMMKKAMKLLHPQSSVFLDTSTSNLILARNLPDMDLNITTISPSIALELCRLKNPTVNLCGGTMNPRTLSVSGINTLELLEKINIDLAFIGVSGCSADVGFTCGTEADMLIKRLVIRKARTRVVLCGADKFKRLMPFTFAEISDVDYIISDEPLPENFVRKSEECGVKIL
ncbi:MAG: DeoR/GlpR transcriptional regulator [Ruminococcaceae bacterium]|nr:DeoR/GlpR transcriptional regulator [Oscillospiraceae bacterium]